MQNIVSLVINLLGWILVVFFMGMLICVLPFAVKEINTIISDYKSYHKIGYPFTLRKTINEVCVLVASIIFTCLLLVILTVMGMERLGMLNREEKELTLVQLVERNPNAIIKVRVTEESWTGEYSSEIVSPNSFELAELTEYNDELLNREDLEYILSDTLSTHLAYSELTTKEFSELVEKEVDKHTFVKYIVINV